ncbi:hypothetical protein [Taklimakanibacter lacteus]|uniref:hypothetical protein n=1 Tax=Taklimakanibacter lacteus TaxID=2268456 RepID=UPI0013C3F679
MTKLRLTVSVAAMALIIGGAATASRAADYVEDPGCLLSGSVMAGFMYDWQSSEFSDEGDEFDGKDVDWTTPFGEGAGLVTCGAFNIQADVAYYAHSADLDFDDADLDQTNTHIGGALFYRDPGSWAGGVSGSWIGQDIFGKDIDTFRVGLFGEFYFDDMFTLGASAHYYNRDWPSEFILDNKDEDGFELAAWGRFYATPDLALTLRGDVLLASLDFDNENADLEGFAITGDAEYLVWDQGLAIFGGARYADRQLDSDEVDEEAEIEDFQVFGGLKFYFGYDGTLIERQRTGTVDNTSVFHEKLPEFFTSGVLATNGPN